MRNNEIVKRLKRIGFNQGIRKRHYTIWNCPCSKEIGAHPVHVGNQPSKELYFKGTKGQLGPHREEFGKI